jgi:hypothetical protein
MLNTKKNIMQIRRTYLRQVVFCKKLNLDDVLPYCHKFNSVFWSTVIRRLLIRQIRAFASIIQYMLVICGPEDFCDFYELKVTLKLNTLCAKSGSCMPYAASGTATQG